MRARKAKVVDNRPGRSATFPAMTTQCHVTFLAGLAVLPLSLLLPDLRAQGEKAGGTGEKYDLRISTAKDTAAWFKTKSQMSQQIDMAGQQIEVSVNTEVILSAKVIGKGDDGSLTVEVVLAAVRGTAEVPMMGESTFDSTTKEGEDDEMGKAFLTLAGRKLTATLSPTGKVTKLDGAKEAIEAATGGGGMGTQMVAGMINEPSLKLHVQRLFGRLPKEPVGIGDTWDGEHDPASARNPVETKSKLTLTKADRDQFEISVAGKVSKPDTIAPDKDAKGGEEGPGAEMQQQMMKNMKVENGTLKGRIVISRKDGMVAESSEEAVVDIKVTNPMGEMSVHQSNKATTERTTADAAKPKPKEEKKDAKGDKGDKGKDEKKEGK
jgi:hypothetical protein